MPGGTMSDVSHVSTGILPVKCVLLGLPTGIGEFFRIIKKGAGNKACALFCADRAGLFGDGDFFILVDEDAFGSVGF